jgi:tetratricopeptide (TPR) repeat protein
MFRLTCNYRLPSAMLSSVILVMCLAILPAVAQGPPGRPPLMPMSTYRINSPGNLWVVAGKVVTLEGDVIPGARVQVSPLGPAEVRFFNTNPSGEFETTYSPMAERGTDFKVELTVAKKGFQPAHELIDFADFPSAVRLPITLLPEEEDSRLLSRQDLKSHLLPELQTLGPGSGISARSDKEYAKGVQEFVGKGRPDHSLRYFSDVAKHNAVCAKCRTMLALAELDSGNWDGAARHANSAIELTLKDPRTGSPEAMLLAGVMESWMHNPQAATDFLVRANNLDPKDALVLQEIGRAQLQLHKYEIADSYLTRALAAGAGPEARLLRAKALLEEDNLDEADTEMNRYLNGREPKTMPLWGRQVWGEIQNRKKIDALYAASGKGKPKKSDIATVDYLHSSAQEFKGLEAAKDQSELEPILTAVGKNVAALFRDMQNTTSQEKVHLEKLLRNGKAKESMNERYLYLCLMPSDPGVPGFTEYRKNIDVDTRKQGSLDRGYMLTSGFVSAALIFHPAYQSQSTFRYLGREMMDGRETYVIAFAQLPQKAELFGVFRSGDKSAPTFEQGLAWIDVQDYKILRLRTDLLKPLPEIRLTEESTQIDYQDVHFKQLAQGFWLPMDVTVTVRWEGKRLRNVHHYSDFRLFNVEHKENIKEPEPAKASSNVPADPQPATNSR